MCVCVCVFMSVCPPACLPAYLPLLPAPPACLSVCVCVCVWVCVCMGVGVIFALLANIRLPWELLTQNNNLSYHVTELITTVKIFTVVTAGVIF